MTSFKFDFAKGEFELVDGRVSQIAGPELIKNKIEKLLRTEFERYEIYTSYGMPFHNWVYGQRDRELIRIAMMRELMEQIPAQVDGVIRVYDIIFDFQRTGVNVALSVETEYAKQDEVGVWISL